MVVHQIGSDTIQAVVESDEDGPGRMGDRMVGIL